ncbi:MAG: glycosyltransferase [bacterium]|nr:glycosyltransferase [bacterium]
MITKPLLSLIIPAYNEQDYLPALLETVQLARQNYSKDESALEIIVSNNNSTDRTAELARSMGCIVVHENRRTIAAARNAGAAAANGDILMFVDADSLIHPHAFSAIEQALSDERVIGGATGVRMSRLSIGIALSFLAILTMIWLTGMDSGVVFCRRRDFLLTGGYDEKKLFAEDVDFLSNLKQLGRSRKQKLIRLPSVKTVTSARKFDKHGDWHYFPILGRAMLGAVSSPARFTKFARRYWYDNQREQDV